MGNIDISQHYESNKVNIILCGDISSEINKLIINTVFEKSPNNYEFKTMIDLKEEKEYLYFYGELMEEKITDMLMEKIKEKIINNKNNKNIVICFSENETEINLVKASLQSLKPESIIPFFIFVKNNSFSQNLNTIKKLSKISIIQYFGNSINDVNDSNTKKTGEIFKSKIFQIDGYFNERGTIFSDYLFGLLNNVKGELKLDDKIDEIVPGNRNALNIFLFGEPRAGKSRFINLSMGTLISRENSSSSHVTQKFTKYALPMRNNENGEKGQIVLYDSPGLTEDKNIIKEFKKCLDKKLDSFKEKKENTSVLLFFIKLRDGISQTALDFVHYLNNKKFNIFFVITHSKKDSEKTKDYRLSVIHQLKTANTFTGNNLKMLNNDGQNIIPVNLKEDKECGQFYGFCDIYRAIFKLFPDNFIDAVDELNELKDLKQQIGFLTYKKFFFLDNVLTKEDFLSKSTYKLKTQINISAGISSFFGLCPIPFADVPVIFALEIGIIKYAAKLYGFNDDEYSITKLLSLGPGGFNFGTIMGGVSKMLLFSECLDIVPVVGSLVSAVINPGIIKSFGYSIKSFFLKNITDKKIRIIISNTLNDYKSIYIQIKHLFSNENVEQNLSNNEINKEYNTSLINKPMYKDNNIVINNNYNNPYNTQNNIYNNPYNTQNNNYNKNIKINNNFNNEELTDLKLMLNKFNTININNLNNNMNQMNNIDNNSKNYYNNNISFYNKVSNNNLDNNAFYSNMGRNNDSNRINNG